LVAELGLAVGFQAVPGYGGKTALVWLGFAVIAAGFVAARLLVSRGRLTFEQVAAVGVVFVVGVFGLTRLPTSLRSRDAEYKADASVSYRQAEKTSQAGVGADPKFLAFLAKWIPDTARFYVIAGPSVHTSGPHSWAQYVLMPRIEEYYHPCAAQWIVLIANMRVGHVDGVKFGQPFVTYKPGYAVARNLSRCAP
jgi:hypothetical protein